MDGIPYFIAFALANLSLGAPDFVGGTFAFPGINVPHVIALAYTLQG